MMINWEALGAIGELIAAVGVIGSLLYLAVQVRANTKTVRASTYHGMVDMAQGFSLLLGSDAGTASTFTKGLADPDNLTPAEMAQFTYLLHALIRQLENGHYQVNQGTMDLELWEGWTETMRSIVGSPGGLRMWPTVRPRLRPSFVEFVEGQVLPTISPESSAHFTSPLRDDRQSD